MGGVFRRNTVRRTAVAALLAALPLLCGSQQPFHPPGSLRTVSGIVHDKGKEPLRGAVVHIEADDTLAIESYETGPSGEYHFHNLRSGADYTLWATFRGHSSKHHALSSFDHHQDRPIAIVIDLDKGPGIE